MSLARASFEISGVLECSLIALKTSRFIKDSSGEVLVGSGAGEVVGKG